MGENAANALDLVHHEPFELASGRVALLAGRRHILRVRPDRGGSEKPPTSYHSMVGGKTPNG